MKAGKFKGSRLRRNTVSLAHAVSHLSGTSVAQLKAGVQGEYSGYRKAMGYIHLEMGGLDADIQEGAQLQGFKSWL